MKKINKQQSTPEPNKYLTEGAKLLINEIASPAEMLDFMMESFWWMEELGKEFNLQSGSFAGRQFIQSVLLPWFAGGTNVVEKIAIGLADIRGAIGSEGYDIYLSELIQAFGRNCKEGIYVDSDKYLKIISTLLKLSFSIRCYEESLFKKLNQEKASKAA